MTVYIVQELHWEYNDEGFDMTCDIPLKAFLERSDAEAFCCERENAARQTYEAQAEGRWSRLVRIFGGVLTDRTEQEQAQWYRAMQLPEPPSDWEESAYRIGPRPDWEEAFQKALIGRDEAVLFWDFANRVRFYEVIAVEVEP
jgi:hypothetical protein